MLFHKKASPGHDLYNGRTREGVDGNRIGITSDSLTDGNASEIFFEFDATPTVPLENFGNGDDGTLLAIMGRVEICDRFGCRLEGR